MNFTNMEGLPYSILDLHDGGAVFFSSREDAVADLLSRKSSSILYNEESPIGIRFPWNDGKMRTMIID